MSTQNSTRTAESPQPFPPAKPTTWAALIVIEPALQDVERFVRSLPESRTYEDWERVKAQFNGLVGWNTRREELQNYRAHLTCYQHLFNLFESDWPPSDGSGSDCTYCQVEAAEFFRLPTKLGTLADLCRTCADEYSARPTKMRTSLS